MEARKAAQAAARPKTTPPPEREDIWAVPHQRAARRQNDRDPPKKPLRRERGARVEQDAKASRARIRRFLRERRLVSELLILHHWLTVIRSTKVMALHEPPSEETAVDASRIHFVSRRPDAAVVGRGSAEQRGGRPCPRCHLRRVDRASFRGAVKATARRHIEYGTG